ncbi:linear amide C-N hydrolase [Dokdonella sp.]|uniref:linear amide C-N hydrolase n=1 Tax=Dokdonella sp. TaxID=2291710 RepID=UPI003C406DC3
MCTSLNYTNADGAVFYGRTLELSQELPYQVTYFPPGEKFQSAVTGGPPLSYTSMHGMVTITMPDRIPTKDSPLQIDDFKIMEGLNDQGLTFSLLAYPSSTAGKDKLAITRQVLSAIDLGSWVLSQFSNVGDVKAALAEQTVALAPLPVLGGKVPPFHWVVHDRAGASIVLEFDQGALSVHDNPVGVMTNGPDFNWHLTNLNNYTFLNNRDQSSGQFGSLKVHQPDSGIATVGLPSSETSVGRFVRAVYYSEYAEKVSNPDASLRTLAHIMNNFDRPKGITIDAVEEKGEGLDLSSFGENGAQFTTEYTSWTSLSDLNRTQLHIRTYENLNFTMLDLQRLAAANGVRMLSLSALDQSGSDSTDLLLNAKPPGA